MTPEESPNSGRAKILVVEDDAPVQRMYASRLKSKGFDVVTAATGQEAIRKAKEERPDLILLDLILPDRSGYDVCRSLRRTEGMNDIPVIMVSGSVKMREVEARRAGIDCVLYKPVSLAALNQKIKKILTKRRGALAAA